MNYRHHFHAGNFADLLKHALLLDLIARLKALGGGLDVLDTHAGAGLYSLEDERAVRSGEAEAGVGRLAQAVAPPELLADLMVEVGKANAKGELRLYPGSPWLALSRLQKGDSYTGCELRADDGADLKALARGRSEADRRMVLGDGYETARTARLAPRRRLLVLIDPPFEQGHDYDEIVQTSRSLLELGPACTVAIWAPIKDLETFDSLVRRLEDLAPASAYVVATRLKSLANPMRLNGSAMIILNDKGPTRAQQATADWIVNTLGEAGGKSECYSIGV